VETLTELAENGHFYCPGVETVGLVDPHTPRLVADHPAVLVPSEAGAIRWLR